MLPLRLKTFVHKLSMLPGFWHLDPNQRYDHFKEGPLGWSLFNVLLFDSQVALENMDVFRETWEHQVRILTEAVDDITTIDDFLAVSGKSHLKCGP